MSLSLRIISGIAVYYILLAGILGYIGQEFQDANVEDPNLDLEGYDDTIDSLNTSSDISILNIRSFWDGLIFSIGSLPWWLNLILSILPLMGVFALIWLVRGNG